MARQELAHEAALPHHLPLLLRCPHLAVDQRLAQVALGDLQPFHVVGQLHTVAILERASELTDNAKEQALLDARAAALGTSR